MEFGTMRRIILSLMTLLLLSAAPALALPTLQLDIQDGVYVGGGDETVYATTNPFTLYALLNDPDPSLLSHTFYVSAAITPNPGSAGGDYGSFTFDGTTVDVTADMTYGTPPDGDKLKDLPGHGIYDTWYRLFAFSFDPSKKAVEYNPQDDPGGLVIDPSGGLYYEDFLVDITGLDPDLSVHFDLYVVDSNGKIIDKAPFSHDAQSSPVPEPASMLLLGAGLIGLAGIGRRKMVK
jgi:hypothetical protein